MRTSLPTLPCIVVYIFLLCCQCLGARQDSHTQDSVYISYAYFEKDDVQRANLDFFLNVGAGFGAHYFKRPRGTFLQVIVAGDTCSPCHRIQSTFIPAKVPYNFPDIRKAYISTIASILYRVNNKGMDIASHNAGIRWLSTKNSLKRFNYFIFLNSSVRGPFIPTYMPQNWQWTDAFVGLLRHGHALAACSITCLPSIDAGGPGPRAESWAFALDRRGLNVALQSKVFVERECKLCDDGIVVEGEYALSKSILNAGLTMATFMSKYRQNIDWSNTSHWQCNNNVHPSRDATYDGVSQHPFELLFVKSSWHVAKNYVDAYTRWALNLAHGNDGTEGVFNEVMYKYAISAEATQ